MQYVETFYLHEVPFLLHETIVTPQPIHVFFKIKLDKIIVIKMITIYDILSNLIVANLSRHYTHFKYL